MKSTAVWITGVSVALAVTAGGVAYASSPAASPSYYGCLKSGLISRVHESPVTCAKGSLAISWNKTGPQGEQGPPGTVTAGPSGLDIIQVTASGPDNGAEAYCPPGHPYLISGGGYSPDLMPILFDTSIYEKYPAAVGWGMTVAGPGKHVVNVEAFCAK